ncbi:MAG: lytic murein transglycosylase [Rhodobacteraceae bacterium]|nr:lytic murein transglycosylase [Paracoccaceae bacterium]
MRLTLATLVLSLAGLGMSAHAQSPAPRPALVAPAVYSAPRPMSRPDPAATVQTVSLSDDAFQDWLAGFRIRARAQGISDRTMDLAFAGVSYDPAIIARDGNQAEFSKALWEYLDSAVSATRIRNGQAALATYSRTLDRIERTYGVDKEVVVAIWGLESAYGVNRGKSDVIQSMATLAYHGRRADLFEAQLIAALKIIQAGDVAPRGMTGSWAGAMGHTQFMPTSYLAFAVDFTGDGKRDIWSDDPTDALASTAAYLARSGWTRGQPWGVEVTLPRGFDYALAGHGSGRTVGDWTRIGVRDMSGRPVRDYGTASILLPAGARGPAFMIFGNFRAIERYNSADSYVIAVGHLADRLKGAPDFAAAWPRNDRALRSSERIELQARLTARGYNTQGVDGRIGPNTISAIRQYQNAAGLVPDGYASVALLVALRDG